MWIARAATTFNDSTSMAVSTDDAKLATDGATSPVVVLPAAKRTAARAVVWAQSCLRTKVAKESAMLSSQPFAAIRPALSVTTLTSGVHDHGEGESGPFRGANPVFALPAVGFVPACNRG